MDLHVSKRHVWLHSAADSGERGDVQLHWVHSHSMLLGSAQWGRSWEAGEPPETFTALLHEPLPQDHPAAILREADPNLCKNMGRHSPKQILSQSQSKDEIERHFFERDSYGYSFGAQKSSKEHWK